MLRKLLDISSIVTTPPYFCISMSVQFHIRFYLLKFGIILPQMHNLQLSNWEDKTLGLYHYQHMVLNNQVPRKYKYLHDAGYFFFTLPIFGWNLAAILNNVTNSTNLYRKYQLWKYLNDVSYMGCYSKYYKYCNHYEQNNFCTIPSEIIFLKFIWFQFKQSSWSTKDCFNAMGADTS